MELKKDLKHSTKYYIVIMQLYALVPYDWSNELHSWWFKITEICS